MREHSAYFVKADSADHVYKLRNQILLNVDEFKSVSKYLARVGLFTTGDIPTGDVSVRDVALIEDVKVNLEVENFSFNFLIFYRTPSMHYFKTSSVILANRQYFSCYSDY